MNRPKERPESQKQRFIEAARELQCEESEERFEEALKKVAKPKPKKDEASEE